MTQRDIALALGVSGASVSEWESGKVTPREDALAKLAAFLGVTPAYLRYGVTGGSVVDRLKKEPERPAAELLQQKAPAKQASAKTGTGQKAG